ncbi:unnamed protein product [Allacma fusca]|uniref:Uncharacterized protein n=1 Tax=Allacma fusca TaxID=39272 RepID=A0A8J2P434_9HEXA|nr:unnamed protein product [Allacma fusca]
MSVETETAEIPITLDVTEDPRKCNPGKLVQIFVGAWSMIFGIALFCSATVWFANIEAGTLSRGICVAFAFGILSGIFQFGSTQILCLLGMKSKWKFFVWFTLPSFVGSMIVFQTSVFLYSYPPQESNARAVQKELQVVIIVSGLNCAFIGIFLITNFLTIAVRKMRSIPYAMMD